MGKTDRKVRIFSALEVANICGVVNQTAINWIKNGYLEAFTTPGGQYRVYSENLVRFLESRNMRVPPELEELRNAGRGASTILIVDDDRQLNDVIRRFVEQKRPELTILQAFDGFEAGRMLAESKPGVVVLDVDLPGIDGRRLCRTIKDDPNYSFAVVVAISGYNVETVRGQMLSEGADAFLEKPIELETLLEAVEGVRA